MAKTIKVRTSLYDVIANVVIKNNATSEIEVVEWSGEGRATKNIRALKKVITDSYKDEDNTYTVIAIDNIRTYKRVYVTTYKIDANVNDIINACISAGLSVANMGTVIVDNTDNDNEESKDSE